MAKSDPIEIAAEIVAAFISNNSVPIIQVSSLIESVHAALSAGAGPGQGSEAGADRPIPAVSVPKSITPDYLICLDDGKCFKSLRRHLALLGMTPEQYRAKWGLPPDYPMVAGNNAAQRSKLATEIGLGHMRKKLANTAGQALAQNKLGRPRKTP